MRAGALGKSCQREAGTNRRGPREHGSSGPALCSTGWAWPHSWPCSYVPLLLLPHWLCSWPCSRSSQEGAGGGGEGCSPSRCQPRFQLWRRSRGELWPRSMTQGLQPQRGEGFALPPPTKLPGSALAPAQGCLCGALDKDFSLLPPGTAQPRAPNPPQQHPECRPAPAPRRTQQSSDSPQGLGKAAQGGLATGGLLAPELLKNASRWHRAPHGGAGLGRGPAWAV